MPAEGRVEVSFSAELSLFSEPSMDKSGLKLNPESVIANSASLTPMRDETRRAGERGPALKIAQIAAFSALIAVGTFLSNILLGITLPYPLYEINAAPAFYLSIAVLYPRRISFWSTVIGSAVGETVNVIYGGTPLFVLSFVPGIILARAPETLIVHRFREKKVNWLAVSMAVATIYEAIVFFLIDWPIYSFSLFYGCPPNPPCTAPGLVGGFVLAAPDLLTVVDLLWIPVAFLLVLAVRRAYNVKFFG